jgi:hypothetical protein
MKLKADGILARHTFNVREFWPDISLALFHDPSTQPTGEP